jgi:hypothetical protein
MMFPFLIGGGATEPKEKCRRPVQAGGISFIGGGSVRGQVYCGCFAGPSLLELVGQLLPFPQIAHPRALDRGNMDEYVRRAIFGLNEAKTLGGIEPLNGASGHGASIAGVAPGKNTRRVKSVMGKSKRHSLEKIAGKSAQKIRLAENNRPQ